MPQDSAAYRSRNTHIVSVYNLSPRIRPAASWSLSDALDLGFLQRFIDESANLFPRVLLDTHELPPGFAGTAWHSVALELRGGVATASVSHARLGDPVATLRLRLHGNDTVGAAGVTARGAGVGVDNLSVLAAAKGAPASDAVLDSHHA